MSEALTLRDAARRVVDLFPPNGRGTPRADAIEDLREFVMITDHAADIASKRTPGPRERIEALHVFYIGTSRLEVIKRADVLAIEDEAANTYDELLAVVREALVEWDQHGTDAALWVLHIKVRSALAALDKKAEAQP